MVYEYIKSEVDRTLCHMRGSLRWLLDKQLSKTSIASIRVFDSLRFH